MTELYCPRIAILASGNGSTAEAFIRATRDGRVDAEVGLIVCNNPPEKAGIYGRVENLNRRYGLNIEIVQINGLTHPNGNVGRGQTLEESTAICDLISRGNFAHVALMGYMKEVRGDLVREYGWKKSYESTYQARMTNTHPGPLPETVDTYGIHTSARVLELGLTESKHTFHLVSDSIDTGPIITEHPVEVLDDDSAHSLFERVKVVEKTALPYALGNFLREQRDYRA